MKIRFCPACGYDGLTIQNEKHWQCSACGFQYFHNMASAVAGIIQCGDEILLAKRKYNPGKGLFDLPGGFVDYRESLEQAMERECQEELGLVGLNWHYLFSYPNQYLYADILYHTQDAFFVAELSHKPEVHAQDDVSEIGWVKLDEIRLEQIAFESIREGLKRFLVESTR